ncbi:MotA/TolQ/ExbB proton channel family protein [Croceibacterium aestuarii]|uniref:MotA/TolQ/ExbB proton channel family protein n=1 Tax=Croceibacterium aestuarii TaxID=3064139 RepID=UPI00272E1008|nr:MotA/TolQ/ExbB proton channel family protein [Croceibacterium sp. D39]
MTHLFDPLSAAIVLGGTIVAVFLRCGWRDTRCAAVAVSHLMLRAFDSEGVRAELAVQIQEIADDGLLRAEPHHFGDGEFDELSDVLVRHRSIQALYEEHERYRHRRAVLAGTAGRVLAEAADLAPVLGLAGTLLSLGGLSTAAEGDYARSIGTAVTTTLYGLVVANFLFAPLSTAVDRRARAEERDRQALLDWLAKAIESACSRSPVATPTPPRAAA